MAQKHRTPPLPPHFETAKPGTCRWCNEPIGPTKTGKPSKSRWHDKCVHAYKMLFWPAVTRRAVWQRDHGKCADCGTVCNKKGNSWHMDHIKPLIESHGNIEYWGLKNLQTLCKPCHHKKTGKESTERALKRREKKNNTKDC